MKILHRMAMPLLLAPLAACQTPPPSTDTPIMAPLAKTAPFASVDAVKAMAAGDNGCLAVVQTFIDRIEAYDKPSGLNAITVVNPDALAIAAELDTRYAGVMEGLPPLFCVPVLIKDNIDTVGLPTTGGSDFLADIPVADDAFIYRRLVEAGAVPIAKTNMAEWAFSPRQSISATYGRTANAYALDATPAGSSGGTASGVAAGFAVIGIGTDTGNSVRGPSSHLALTGLRPTLGLVSRDGIVPLSFDRDTAGPMVRSARDAAQVMAVIAGSDPADSYTAQAPRLDYLAAIEAADLRGKTIGILSDLASPDASDPEVMAAFDAAVQALQRAGASVEPVSVPDFEALANDGSMFCPRFGYDLQLYLTARSGGEVDASLLRNLSDSKTYGADVLVPGGLDYFAGFPADVHPAEWEQPCPDLDSHPARQAFRTAVIATMDAGSFDALIYPSWARLPAQLESAHDDYAGDNNQVVSPPTGLPAVTTPMGFSNSGLPMGLQFLGRPYSDAELLGLAHAFERQTAHWRAPDAFPPLSPADQN